MHDTDSESANSSFAPPRICLSYTYQFFFSSCRKSWRSSAPLTICTAIHRMSLARPALAIRWGTCPATPDPQQVRTTVFPTAPRTSFVSILPPIKLPSVAGPRLLPNFKSFARQRPRQSAQDQQHHANAYLLSGSGWKPDLHHLPNGPHRQLHL